MTRILRYTESELVEAFRTHNGLTTASPGITVSGASEERVEAMARELLRTRYSALLRNAPIRHVPVRDLKGSVTQTRLMADGGLYVRLPSDGYRLIEVKLPEWDRGVNHFVAPESAMARRQSNIWLQATPSCPCVIAADDHVLIYGLRSYTSGQESRVAPDMAGRLEYLLMTAPPLDGTYEFEASHFLELVSIDENSSL